jgi:hypothetical protein
MNGVPRKNDYPATFTVEFGCDRACQVELDLDGVHIRFTLGQMLERAKLAHTDAHAREWPTRVHAWRDDVLVRATLLAEAVTA